MGRKAEMEDEGDDGFIKHDEEVKEADKKAKRQREKDDLRIMIIMRALEKGVEIDDEVYWDLLAENPEYQLKKKRNGGKKRDIQLERMVRDFEKMPEGITEQDVVKELKRMVARDDAVER